MSGAKKPEAPDKASPTPAERAADDRNDAAAKAGQDVADRATSAGLDEAVAAEDAASSRPVSPSRSRRTLTAP